MIISINHDAWVNGLARLQAAARVFGPQAAGSEYEYRELATGQLPDFSGSNTRLSPKHLVHPQSQIMFQYTLDQSQPDAHVLKELPVDVQPNILLGVRPCDAAAFVLVRRNFDAPDVKDPYWLQAYDKLTQVGLACTRPCETCFCTSAGCGPFSETGLDVLLVAQGDGFLAQAITDKGQKLLADAGWQTPAEPSAADTLTALKTEAEAAISSQVATDQLRRSDSLALYEAPFWDEVSFSCINCGTCTYLCPTCWCFDIQDECQGSCGVRMRNWDSCMYPLFTLHGTGHNPRGTKLHRVRQRFMHKLKYYVDKYDNGIQCVGCGRCIRLCPVNIDIRRVCDTMNNFNRQAACAA